MRAPCPTSPCGTSMTLFVMLVLVTLGSLRIVQSAVRTAPRKPVDDFEAPPETRFHVNPFLSFGEEVKVESIWDTDFDLDTATTDDQMIVTPTVALAVSFMPHPNLEAFLNVELTQDLTLVGPDEPPSRVQFTLKKAFVTLTDVLGSRVDLQIGRQTFEDDRKWLIDEELDAVRVWSHWSALTLEVSVSRRGLVRRDVFNVEAPERIINYLLMGRMSLTPAHTVATYLLFRDDRAATRESCLFLGLHAHGAFREIASYWLEFAHVRGREGLRTLRGYGVDLGMTFHVPLPWQPALTVGVAFGSGDTDATGDVDRSFRQTGLHGNEGKWAGVAKFKYYGELLDPELSNLLIVTGGIGLRPTRASSLDLVAHAYVQHAAAQQLRGASLDMHPTGHSRELGREIDLIVGYAYQRQVKARWILGVFFPGQAYPADADHAFFAKFEVEYSLGHR